MCVCMCDPPSFMMRARIRAATVHARRSARRRAWPAACAGAATADSEAPHRARRPRPARRSRARRGGHHTDATTGIAAHDPQRRVAYTAPHRHTKRRQAPRRPPDHMPWRLAQGTHPRRPPWRIAQGWLPARRVDMQVALAFASDASRVPMGDGPRHPSSSTHTSTFVAR